MRLPESVRCAPDIHNPRCPRAWPGWTQGRPGRCSSRWGGGEATGTWPLTGPVLGAECWLAILLLRIPERGTREKRHRQGVHFTSPSPGWRERRMEALECSCPHPPSEPASFKSGWLHSWGWEMAAEVTHLGHLSPGT